MPELSEAEILILRTHLADSWERISENAPYTPEQAAQVLWQEFPLLRAAARDFESKTIDADLLDKIVAASITIGPEQSRLAVLTAGVRIILAGLRAEKEK